MKGLWLIALGIFLFIISRLLNLLCVQTVQCQWYDLPCIIATGTANAVCNIMVALASFILFWLALLVIIIGVLRIVFKEKKK